ncbi:polysaccharide biosynthesis/export family protein [Vannielia litorea]|uniref:Polysaccharide export outer membrane protein n=1 Tax=Vannielia litorea TaxID=1217970 RepID=A0A1N6G5Q1_9RHOB|nr:polysaccharide biosynthesis/export family protein [Vannielia litorea]SIO02876.1 polysaccharide export outer membrane protein [Vannielia litorea]
MRRFGMIGLCVVLAACGTAYQSPKVRGGLTDGTRVRVVPVNAETTLLANRSQYDPRTLPAIFSTGAGAGGGLRSSGALPDPVFEQTSPPSSLETRLPPQADPGPYAIGVGDVILLATPKAGGTVEELSGLLAAQNARQGYTVQDDGSVNIPSVGRVRIAGMTVEEAEAELFQRMVQSQIDPTFSLEIAEFNSQKVSVGGAVSNPAVASIRLTPLYLDQALAAAGGVTAKDLDYASIRIYREGALYQIPLREFYARSGLKRIRLIDGDSIFVDTEYELDQAQSYFEQQITLAGFRSQQRRDALSELSTEIAIRRDALNEARQNYRAQVEFDAVDRDYVYLTGEVERQARFPLPLGRQASLADALFEGAGGIPLETGNVREIYVLRASDDPREFGAVTAWHLDGRNAANFTLAAKFELRPDDVIFVAEQPVTRWNRVVRQITPSLITTGARAWAN